MSLRIVHIIFIVASTLIAFGFGVWAIVEYRNTGAVLDLALGLGSFVGGAALIWYGNKFFKKLKTLKAVSAA
jgi:hypothetical protein